jgi:hypothetical protein
MSEKAKAETIERPTLKPGEMFATLCKCGFVKFRRNFSDARGWQRDHQASNPSHTVTIEARKASEKPTRAVKPAKVKKPEAAKRLRSKARAAGAAAIPPEAVASQAKTKKS